MQARNEQLFRRWSWLLKELSSTIDPRHTYHRIELRYNEPHRKYHTLQHVKHAIDQMDLALIATRGKICDNPRTVEYALWLHDIIYDPNSNKNEEESAWMAKMVAFELGLSDSFGDQAAHLVMTTTHKMQPRTPDEKLIADCDLSSLGSSPKLFDEYNENILAEYARYYTPEQLREGRRRFMSRFLVNDIFHTDYFKNRYEARAKANVERLVKSLS